MKKLLASKVRILIRAYFYPTVLHLVAFVPGLNRIYYGDGLGWSMLGLSLTWVISILAFECLREKQPAERKRLLKFSFLAVLNYMLLMVPLGVLADLVLSIWFGFGWKVSGVFWFWSTFPFSWIVYSLIG